MCVSVCAHTGSSHDYQVGGFSNQPSNLGPFLVHTLWPCLGWIEARSCFSSVAESRTSVAHPFEALERDLSMLTRRMGLVYEKQFTAACSHRVV